MEIRLARKSDIPYLQDIFNYEVQFGTASFAIQERTPEEMLLWYEAHNRENHPLIVAAEGEHVTGYASLSEFRASEAYKKTVELSVYVAHDYRRRGTAALLMTEILNMARADDDIHAVISVITAGNTASIQLHEKLGFQFCGTFREVGLKFGSWLDTVNYQLLV